jgi:LysR family transcriptional activator of nhaA
VPGAINHNHLYYFWLAARHRSLTLAARALGLSQPTVSAQIRSLEEQLNAALFTRQGRAIDLTEAGQIVFRHADEMFRISAELQLPDALSGRFTGAPTVLHVGVSDFVPKTIVRTILEPVLRDEDARFVFHEWRIDELITELGLLHLDLLIVDRPHPDGARVRAASYPVF